MSGYGHSIEGEVNFLFFFFWTYSFILLSFKLTGELRSTSVDKNNK